MGQAALLKNMNALNVTKAIDNYQCNVNHIQRCMHKLKHFGSLFDHSRNDNVNIKIERGGILLGIQKRKKIVDPKFIEENLSGWESKLNIVNKKLQKAKDSVKEVKSKVEERRKQASKKKKDNGDGNDKKIADDENDENKKQDKINNGSNNKFNVLKEEEEEEDEPLPAG